MMKIKTSKFFRKQYIKLNTKQKEKVNESIRLFKENPFDPSVKNHALKGKMQGKNSISAGGDLRFIFEQHKNYTLVLFLDVGSHNQVY